MRRFLNRADSIDRILRFLTDEASATRILQVVGAEGVGKTELLKQAAKRQHGRVYVGVDRAEGASHGQSSLVSKVAAQMEHQAQADGFRNRRVLMSEMTRDLKSQADAVLTSALKSQKTVALFKKWLSKGDIPFNVGENSSESHRYYIKLALEDVQSVIHIDHAEECVPEDWDFIDFLVSATSALIVVESRTPLLPPPLRERGRSAFLNVPRLELRYADVLFDELPAGLRARMRAEFNNNGDLRKYDELFARRDGGVDDGYAGADLNESVRAFSRDAMGRLSDDDRNVLIAIAAHVGAPVGFGLLGRFLDHVRTNTSVIDLHGQLKRLEDALLIIKSSYDARVSSSVRAVILGDGRLLTRLTVLQKDWREFLREAVGQKIFIPDEQRWLQMLRQSVSLNDAVGVASCLEEIGSLHRDVGSRVDSVGLVKRLLAELELADDPIVAVAFARYLYVAGWFDDARDVLAPVVEAGARRDRYLYAELMCAAGPVERGIRSAKKERRSLQVTGRNDPDAELCLELIILHGLRSSNQLEAARERYLSVCKIKKYSLCAAYPVLLRFADVCLYKDKDFPACVSALEAAMEAAALRGQWQEVVSARIALTEKYGYTDLDKAAENLAAAISSDKAMSSQQMTIMNNLSVIGMYRKEINEDILRTLYSALLLSQDPLDNLLLRNNITVAHILLGREVESSFVEALENSCASPLVDNEIRKITLYNLSVLFRIKSDERRSDYFQNSWRQIEDVMDHYYWSFRRSGIGSQSIRTWRTDLDCYPVLLSDWKLGTVPFEAVLDNL